MADAARETLRRAGFDGCGEHLETVSGLFFPQHPLGDVGDHVVCVATEIFFNFGAPALMLKPTGPGTARLRDIVSMADEASSDVAREKSPDGLSGYRSVSV